MADASITIDRCNLLMSLYPKSVRSRRDETILHGTIETRRRGNRRLERLKAFFMHFDVVVGRRELEGLRRLAARPPVDKQLRVRGVSLHAHPYQYRFEPRQDGKFATRIGKHGSRPVFIARRAQDHLVRDA